MRQPWGAESGIPEVPLRHSRSGTLTTSKWHFGKLKVALRENEINKLIFTNPKIQTICLFGKKHFRRQAAFIIPKP